MGAGSQMVPTAERQGSIAANLVIRQHWHVEAFDRDGNLKWQDSFDNLVVTEGLTDILEQYYNGTAYTAVHYVGLTAGTPSFAAGDTMASHGGWTEVVEYTNTGGSPESNIRALFTPAAAAAASIDNSAAKAVFDIIASMTVGGAFLTTDITKGGTSGTLVGGNAFTGGDRSLSAGDTLNVTVTASMTSS